MLRRAGLSELIAALPTRGIKPSTGTCSLYPTGSNCIVYFWRRVHSGRRPCRSAASQTTSIRSTSIAPTSWSVHPSRKCTTPPAWQACTTPLSNLYCFHQTHVQGLVTIFCPKRKKTRALLPRTYRAPARPEGASRQPACHRCSLGGTRRRAALRTGGSEFPAAPTAAPCSSAICRRSTSVWQAKGLRF